MRIPFGLSGQVTPRHTALLVAAVAVATIAGAWVFQYGLGIEPCELCYKQRIPYYVAVPVALMTACLPNRSMTIRIGLAFLFAIFLGSAILAGYHAGVEWKFWSGPAACAGGDTAVTSAADLMRQIERSIVISCSEASWRFLGLSLAGWNALISLGLAVTALSVLLCQVYVRRQGNPPTG